jgi:hypothetical protein
MMTSVRLLIAVWLGGYQLTSTPLCAFAEGTSEEKAGAKRRPFGQADRRNVDGQGAMSCWVTSETATRRLRQTTSLVASGDPEIGRPPLHGTRLDAIYPWLLCTSGPSYGLKYDILAERFGQDPAPLNFEINLVNLDQSVEGWPGKPYM